MTRIQLKQRIIAVKTGITLKFAPGDRVTATVEGVRRNGVISSRVPERNDKHYWVRFKDRDALLVAESQLAPYKPLFMRR